MSIRVHRKDFLAIKCWRILEDFRREYIQFFNINCGLFMRLHFTIGCYDCRWTSRRCHGFQFSGIQIFFC